MRIRSETEADYAAIRGLLEQAYGNPEVADMVEQLRGEGGLLSLVAELDGKLIGHTALAPVTLDGHPEIRLTGMAVTAVNPAHRADGVGSELVHEGLVISEHVGASAVITLGYPAYYARFGFEPAEPYGFQCEYATVQDQFLIRFLVAADLEGSSGTVRYPQAFRFHPAAPK